MVTISAKCTTDTKLLIDTILKKHPFFIKLQKEGIYVNPSWFCKFSISLLLNNIKLIEKEETNLTEFAYQSHYVDIFDNRLSQFINEEDI